MTPGTRVKVLPTGPVAYRGQLGTVVGCNLGNTLLEYKGDLTKSDVMVDMDHNGQHCWFSPSELIELQLKRTGHE